ncbi:SAS2 [Candida theae]|uniref:histone acetyltransferase n=1 Tax=Candida theae TaxID=1198502 RepID=A0AAD5FY10_9ASCO|nr:SAS2 [Candida theae]KAI5957489.1 SAS2 [Candida theae]
MSLTIPAITQDQNKKKSSSSKSTSYYGRLDKPNIGKVTFGQYEFEPWYGNPAYFHPYEGVPNMLGYEYVNMKSRDPIARKRLKSYSAEDCFVDHLYVCEYCFKYTANENEMLEHWEVCSFHRENPNIGTSVYYDRKKNHIIREVKGYEDPLFCQNLCLFGKLFLDDKSVYFNIDHFNFYVFYAKDKGETDYIPMGFFSKEMIAYDPSTNLACICVFPPFQRRHIGAMLIEFSYAIASLTQESSGPEIPLSPYGKVSYLSYWAKNLAKELTQRRLKKFTFEELSRATGYRKEDILFTLEHMEVLEVDSNGEVSFSSERFQHWMITTNFDANKQHPLLDTGSFNL